MTPLSAQAFSPLKIYSPLSSLTLTAVSLQKAWAVLQLHQHCSDCC